MLANRDKGRIAQLVERLSYTQVVIGSSPFAPIILKLHAGVVQLVRAPPCHGGSCGFEPRLPRIFIGLAILLMISCSTQTPDDFKKESRRHISALICELKKIRNRDDLLLHTSELQFHFNSIADLMIRSKEYHAQYGETDSDVSEQNDLFINDQLSIELNRVLHMEGGREIILKVQKEAINNLNR